MHLDEQTKDKLSLVLSIFIALCVIGLFCAISIAISHNIEQVALEKQHDAIAREASVDPDIEA